MSPRDAPHQHVLAEFDRAVGLDATLRTTAALGSARSSPAQALPPPTARASPSPADTLRVSQRPSHTIEPRPPESRLPEPRPSETFVSSAEWQLDPNWLTDAGGHTGRVERLAQIQLNHDEHCPHCTTATAHTRTVFGEGSATAEVMFVGEAPGETEDQLGRPFVGRAGQKLDEMIKAMGYARQDVYIANVLKSRPPGNRTPLQHEVDACGPYLVAQLLAIRPKVIVTLGGPATKLVLGEMQGITRLRGIWREWAPPQGSKLEPVAVMPTYHPAYLLRNYTPKVRAEVWSDLKAVLVRLGKTPAG